MKRDCPSLIFAKTQFLFHFRLFFIGHGCEVVSYRNFPYLGFPSAIFRDVTHLSTIVTFRWWSCGWGTVDVHCIFVFYLDCDCFFLGLAWSGLRICPCYLELPFSVVLFGFAELFFYFCGASVPCLELSVYASITGVS